MMNDDDSYLTEVMDAAKEEDFEYGDLHDRDSTP